MSNLGRWDNWYAGLNPSEPQAYGDVTTYAVAAKFLDGLRVEDWGCGKGYFRTLIPPHLYRGVDGSATPFADEIVDLCTYQSTSEGIFLRHVLEHNDRWERILANAVASTTRRLALVLFTPMADQTVVIARPFDIGVPDISFAHDDIIRFFDGARHTHEDYVTATQYGVERVYLVEFGSEALCQ